MAIQFLHPQALEPGDILLSGFDWREPTHWIVAFGARTPFCHATLFVGLVDGHQGLQEWSIQGEGSILRPYATDRFVLAYRADDPNWRDIGKAAAAYALEHAVQRYNFEGAAWVGIQRLAMREKILPLPRSIAGARYCFEGVTDVYTQVGFDVCPLIEDGAVLGTDIAAGRTIQL